MKKRICRNANNGTKLFNKRKLDDINNYVIKAWHITESG